MMPPTEARLGEMAETLQKIEAEVESWEDSDFEWLKRRLIDSIGELKFMIQMKFRSKGVRT